MKSLKIAVLLCVFSMGQLEGSSRIINGTEAPAGKYPEVVFMDIGDGSVKCTATVVGPRALLTAAHCAVESKTASFSIKGTQYKVTLTQSPDFPKDQHDVAIGLLDKAVSIKPATISGSVVKGNAVQIMGYGCTKSDLSGGNDGILRMGETVVTRFDGQYMVLQKADGAAICYGDSGGPTYKIDSGKRQLVGVNSRGNALNTTFSTRLDEQRTIAFLKNWASQHAVDVCGITKDCDGGTDPQPSCQLAASPSTVEQGKQVTLTLTPQGKVTTALINGTSVNAQGGSLTVQATQVGTVTAQGEVTGPGGTGTCTTSYTVTGGTNPTAPTCTLVASPNKIKLGETVVLSLTAQGNAVQAFIDGAEVAPPKASKSVTPKAKGQYQATGWVVGPGGQNSCKATYSVEDGSVQPVPNFAAVPAYCGKNSLSQTDVDSVCVSVIKRINNKRTQYMTRAIQITYRNGVTETLPVLHEDSSNSSKHQLKMYTNKTTKVDGYSVLKNLDAELSFNASQQPTSIEGRSSIGHYFIVANLTVP